MQAHRVETILKGGVVPTVPTADSLAIGGGKILAIGQAEEMALLASEITQTIDLKGRTVLPGFIDAHTHFLQVGLEEISSVTDLSELNRADALAKLAEAVRARGEGEWVIGRGWDESVWQDPSYLSREELDRIAPKNPVVAVRIDGHLLTVNNFALKQIPADVNQGQVDISRGILREKEAFAFLRAIEPDAETLRDALYAATALAHRLGITSIHTMLPPDRIRPYMRERGRIKLRVTLYPEIFCLDALEALGIESGFGDEWLRLGGVKLFADGSIGAGNAALGEPFVDSGENGSLNYTDEELVHLVRHAVKAGLQTAIHAIGDRAIEQVLRAHLTAGTPRELRHRIEHFELPTKAQIERARDMGLNISMQPNFVGNWSGDEKMYQARLGAQRDRRSDPHRLVLEAGLPLAFGSDCMPISPLYGLHWAVNAPYPSQRVSVSEGISCYTEAGAYLSFEEAKKGKIEVGMDADLVVLDQDPHRVPERIAELHVEMTFVDGEVVFRRGDESCA